MAGVAPLASVASEAGVDLSTRYLLRRLGVVEQRVAALVRVRRASDPNPDDPLRGMVLGDAEVDRLLRPAAQLDPPLVEAGDELLAQVEREADQDEAEGARLSLRSLARSFRLEPIEVELLMVALAPDLDPRFERLYGYLHDDLTRRRASVGLALELAGARGGGPRMRARLAEGSPLVDGGLVLVEE